MSAPQQIIAAGTASTGAGLAGFVTFAEPLMKLITFGLTTAVGIATLIYTVKKIRERIR